MMSGTPGINKGSKHYKWKGGVAPYSNYGFMRKQRLIILINNPKCEYCGKPADRIHHRNFDKSDHRLVNLAASCCRCNGERHKTYISKYRKLYGYSLCELGKKFNISYGTVKRRLKYNISLEHPKGKWFKNIAK